MKFDIKLAPKWCFGVDINRSVHAKIIKGRKDSYPPMILSLRVQNPVATESGRKYR
jgi:hypothetical protein